MVKQYKGIRTTILRSDLERLRGYEQTCVDLQEKVKRIESLEIRIATLTSKNADLEEMVKGYEESLQKAIDTIGEYTSSLDASKLVRNALQEDLDKAKLMIGDREIALRQCREKIRALEERNEC